jgi:aspartate-semialdehyde dehydrogenase
MALAPLRQFGIKKVITTTMQAIPVEDLIALLKE